MTKEYDVLKEVYKAAGKDFHGNVQYNVSWKKIGTCNSFADAKRKYGGYPVVHGIKAVELPTEE